jgi:hypothetical protein
MDGSWVRWLRSEGVRENERFFDFAQDDKARLALAQRERGWGQTAMNGGATGWRGAMGMASPWSDARWVLVGEASGSLDRRSLTVVSPPVEPGVTVRCRVGVTAALPRSCIYRCQRTMLGALVRSTPGANEGIQTKSHGRVTVLPGRVGPP